MNNDYFPWEEIPDSNVFPTMTGLFEYTKLEDGKANNGKRMFRAQFTCVQPESFAGMAHFENFVTGTDENPEGILPATMGSRALKSSLNAAQIAPNPKVGEICALVCATKPKLMLSLSHSTEKSGEFAGQERNRVTAYHKVGERQVSIAPGMGQKQQVMQAPAAPAMPQPVAPAATQAPAAPAAPVQQAPAAPAAPVAQTPAAPSAPQVAAPSQTPVAPAAPAEVAAPAAPSQTLPCQLCGNQVAIENFSAHVQRHQTDPAWNGVG